MTFEVIVTVGPRLLQERCLEAVIAQGATILRINGAHQPEDGLIDLLKTLRVRAPTCRLLLDISGRKIRTRNLTRPIQVRPGDQVVLHDYNLNFPDILKQITPGTVVMTGDGMVHFEVSTVESDTMVLLAKSSGEIVNGKGLHFPGINLEMPVISEAERTQVRVVSPYVDIFGLSYVYGPEDVDYMFSVVGDGNPAKVLPKLETAGAYQRHVEIMDKVPAVLIDRGDLASELGIFEVARAVTEMTNSGHQRNTTVLVATQFLSSMTTTPTPLI